MSDVKERTFRLRLSDADCERLMSKASGVGITAEAILENFIADLVCGDNTNGSDERMYAQDWFDRCGFQYTHSDNTFVSWLVRYGDFEDVCYMLDELDAVTAELCELEAEPDENLYEENEAYRLDTAEYIAHIKGQLEEPYGKYNDRLGGINAQSFDEAMDGLREYRKKLAAFMEEGDSHE